MVSKKLKELFGNVKERLGEKLSEIKPEEVAKFAAKEAVGAIPVVGQIIKDVFDEFSPDEKEELIKELKELSESQFNEISEKVGVSVEYLKDIQRIALYSFRELRADHEVIKELIWSLIEELKPPEINIPPIQSVLRKEETFVGDFFKKEPEWIDFEEGFVVERREVDEIIKKLENDNVQLVLGEPASGKSVILKNIGFKLAKENKDVHVVELKKHSIDEVKRYFYDILEIKDEKAVFIVDDAHLLHAECERLVREFKKRKLKAKFIIGSRPTREIRGEHPKEASEFEYLSKTEIHAEDVTEEMIKTFLKRKYGFSDERINTVSENLEEYRKDLWHLSWALKAYNPEKDSVEEKEIYRKIKNSIRDIRAGVGKINAEDVFLPLSVFYRFEISVERDFLEEQLKIEEDKINRLIELSEIIEREEIGRNRMLSLIHSSIADLYFRAYKSYPDFGIKIKKGILNQREKDLEYRLFYKYMTSTDPRNAVDVMIHLGDVWSNEEGGITLRKKLIEDDKIQGLIKEGIEQEENVEKIGFCVLVIAIASEEVGLKLANCINIDALSSKIEKEEDIRNIGICVSYIAMASKEVGLKLANRINIDIVSSKIEKKMGYKD
uniref:Novel STAND NTPase 5 domain-containing protein n=1 Tax=Candidatus Methanophaga sp. ANME-1 ERB7 TaxID=2759913 RepID=A0A7G9Z3M5_9EURY|nr:hypothetical protein GHJHFCIO_00009 [Methanosarcinales archaeon ANME-1 ERB7]